MNRTETGSAIEREEEKSEKGRNGLIRIHLTRHAERTPQDQLTPMGMHETAELAQGDVESGELDDFEIVKGMGSISGPTTEMPSSDPDLGEPEAMPRAMGTAHIYAEGVARVREEKGNPIKRYGTRRRALLGLDGFKNQKPFNWKESYNAQLPDNYNELDEAQQATAAYKANAGNLNRLLSEEGGEEYRQEVASRYAKFMDTYLRNIDRMDSNKKLLLPTGGHGGLMEVFLHEALKRKKGKGKDATERIGFDDVMEIGGAFHPSEGFSVDIATDAEGNKVVKIIMDDGNRLKDEELTLDMDKMEQLVAKYDELYKEPYDPKEESSE